VQPRALDRLARPRAARVGPALIEGGGFVTTESPRVQLASPGTPRGTWCASLELSGDPALDAVLPFAGQPRARVLARLHGEPLGYLTVATPGADPDVTAIARQARTEFAAAVAGHLRSERDTGRDVPLDEPLPAPTDACPAQVSSAELVTVIVCTRNRSGILADCLERLQALTHPHLEVVVVDNAPTDDSTRVLVEAVAAVDERFRYVCEPRPGLSRARNRGLAEARGRIVAYTDDDVAVDAGWVQGLLRGFARRADVGCVTGLVATAGISTPAEEYFDARSPSWSSRTEFQLFDMQGSGRTNALYPYSPGIFGTGANFAFDRQLLDDLGRFDEALGAGTKTRGGEDLDIFVRVLRAGRAIVYEPAAVVWHHHRADHAALLTQMFGYGTGLSAVITKFMLRADTRREVLRRVPAGLRRRRGIAAETTERLGGNVAAPRGAALRELLGLVAGPGLYLLARRAATVRPGGDAAAPAAGA
jgi:glycosyltransferase involved in cell wall biosynthesis